MPARTYRGRNSAFAMGKYLISSSRERNRRTQDGGRRRHDSSCCFAEFGNSLLRTLSLRAADEFGDAHAEADSENGGVWILRREGAAGVARQVRRHGGD